MKKILIINNERDKSDLGWSGVIVQAINNIEECDFEIIHHSEAEEDLIKEIDPDLIYLSGRVTYDWDIEEIKRDYSKVLDLIKKTNRTIVGVCAGIQLIGVAYDADFGKMIDVEEGEEDIREEGFTKVNIVKDDKVFEGLEDSFTCYQLHRDEIKEIPRDFDLLASSEMCKIQVLKNKYKNLYGFQFHPEKYNKEYEDGKTIIKNILDSI